MSKQTVTINGVIYDTQTGMPVDGTVRPAQPIVDFAPKPKGHSAKAMHRTTQKSQTLRRQVVKHATPSVTASTPSPATKPDIARSPSITKFAPHPVGAKPTAPVRRMHDIAPAAHPIAAKAVSHGHRHTATSAHAPKPSQVIKQEAIAEALAKAPTHKTRDKAVRRKQPRALTIASASLALLLLGGYFTYLNMPSLSVRMAAVQSGVSASYPGYHPDGYNIRGLVTYNDSSVNMTFAANGGPQSYTIGQTKSNLDSSAVLENYVKPKAGGSYIPYSQQGLTIYIFGNDAAWVNGGILYTINGNAPLSSDQILHIASSM
jgi:hypothetical protein